MISRTFFAPSHFPPGIGFLRGFGFPLGIARVLAGAAFAWPLVACDGPEKADDAPAPSVSTNVAKPPTPTPKPATPPIAPEIAPEAPPPPHSGPWLWVDRSSAGVYFEPKPNRDEKLGYVQRGGKVPILAEKIAGEGCSKGWYQVASGGYLCSMVGTIDPNDTAAKFPPRQPKIEDILPYPYARNAHNGTPLYRSLPSKDQMLEYEPHLAKDQAEKEKAKDGAEPTAPAAASSAAPTASASAAPASPTAVVDPTGAPPATAGDEAATEPAAPKWWETGENLHEVKLEDLSEDADGILVRRMVKGFYVAVDKTFTWNGRTWYKTTKGLVVPADRFWQAPASDFQGVEIDGEKWKLPVAWVYGANKTISRYEIDVDAKKITTKGSLKRFEPVQLTGKTIEYAGKEYDETSDGTYVRTSQVRKTTPNPRPDGVGDKERWIDVDISQQTLVFYEGDRSIYATLISSGKESKVKEKDHSTPRGMWRVREKHVVTTMDGNGSAAGDLPYSIEDVPYVMYFHKAYATHGAFWHQNFGSQMSHGCVNLAPLDAKWIFFHAEPRLPEGLHGVWSSDAHPGSMVVVHD